MHLKTWMHYRYRDVQYLVLLFEAQRTMPEGYSEESQRTMPEGYSLQNFMPPIYAYTG